MTRRDLLTTTLNITGIRLIGQVVALFNPVVISAAFGTTLATDHFYSAQIIPVGLTSLYYTILSAVFAPIFLSYVHREPDQEKPILASLTFLTVCALALIMVVSGIGLPLLTTLRSISDAALFQQAILYGLVMIALLPLSGLTSFITVLCYTKGQHLMPALLSISNPIIFIGTVALLAPILGPLSMLIGSILAVIADFALSNGYAIWRLRLPFRISPRIHPAVKEMIGLAALPAITYSVLFFVPTADRAAASSLPAGSLTAFHYGERLVTALETLFMNGVITVISTYWATTIAQKGKNAVGKSVVEITSVLAFGLVPLCVGGVLVSHPFVAVLFGRGAFAVVAETADVFGLLLVGMGLGLHIVLFTRLLVYLRHTFIQMVMAFLTSILNVVLNIVFMGWFGLAGIALSTVVTRLIILAATAIILNRFLPEIRLGQTIYRLVATALCTLIMGVVVVVVRGIVWGPGLGFFNQILAVIVMVATGGATYVLAARLIRHPDFRILIDVIAQTRYGRLVKVLLP